MGGDEEPCIPRQQISVFEEKFGRPCPRVELWEVNSEVGRLALKFADILLADEGPYAHLLGTVLSGSLAARAVQNGTEEAEALTDKALAVVCGEPIGTVVVQRLEAQRERQRRKAEQEAKRRGKSSARR